MANPVQRLIIDGDFSTDELARVLRVLRDIDDARPDAKIVLCSEGLPGSIDQVEETFRQVIPEREGRQTSWFSMRREKPHA